jgi:hypothetical protein
VPQPVLSHDPRGRCDVLVVRLGEAVCRQSLEPALGGFPLWDRGLGALVEAVVSESAIPKVPVPIPTRIEVDLLELAQRFFAPKSGRRR